VAKRGHRGWEVWRVLSWLDSGGGGQLKRRAVVWAEGRLNGWTLKRTTFVTGEEWTRKNMERHRRVKGMRNRHARLQGADRVKNQRVISEWIRAGNLFYLSTEKGIDDSEKTSRGGGR